MRSERQRVAAIVGATAVGKTAVSVDVAERLNAEIISIDSMQIYAGMEIGTAAPSAEQRARVPHHLVGVKPPSHELTVAEFQVLARAAISAVTGTGRLPLLVGGSGLYWRAVVDELEFPPRSAAVRAALEHEAEAVGAEAMHRRLEHVDTIAARAIAPSNVRRSIRALEVIAITGRRFSDYSRAWTAFESRYDLKVAGLRRRRTEMFDRVEARVDEMLDAGLIDEARGLASGELSRAARQALGYRQILEADESTPVSEIRDDIARATKRFVRRQESWFNADPRIVWFDASAPDLRDRLIDFLRPSV